MESSISPSLCSRSSKPLAMAAAFAARYFADTNGGMFEGKVNDSDASKSAREKPCVATDSIDDDDFRSDMESVVVLSAEWFGIGEVCARGTFVGARLSEKFDNEKREELGEWSAVGGGRSPMGDVCERPKRRCVSYNRQANKMYE